MADVFNKVPSAYIDMNSLFPVLNDKVGLSSEQWRKAIENANYLYNHLGLADVEVGSVTTVFTEPSTLADVKVEHRETIIDDKTTDYFDFTFYIPSPKIESTLESQIVNSVSDMGIDLVTSPIYGTGTHSNVIIGYKFDFTAKILDNFPVNSVNGKTGDVVLNAEDVGAVKNEVIDEERQVVNRLANTVDGLTVTQGAGGGTTHYDTATYGTYGMNFPTERPTINKTEQMAFLSDINTSIQQAILDSWEASY